MSSTSFAKLITSTGQIHYIRSLSVSLGRRTVAVIPASAERGAEEDEILDPAEMPTTYLDGSKVPHCDIEIGEDSTISRYHCLIYYQTSRSFSRTGWVIRCLSKNGLTVNGVHLPCSLSSSLAPSAPPPILPLDSQSLISIGKVFIYFLLPSNLYKLSANARLNPTPPQVTHRSAPSNRKSSKSETPPVSGSALKKEPESKRKRSKHESDSASESESSIDEKKRAPTKRKTRKSKKEPET